MAHDQETYRRGRSAALLGGVIQLALAVTVLLLGLWAESRAINAAGWYLLGGLPIWIVLWLLYNQHRLERIESLEAEQLSAKDRQAAAMFGDHADELSLARRRIDKLYKWGLSAVSILVSVYLVAIGLTELHGERTPAVQRTPAMAEDANVMVLIVVMASIGFIAFVVARYLAGMTKVREWQLLRGGAGYLMGNFLVALLVVIASVAISMGNDVVFKLLAIIVPAIMVLVGVEMLLTFLLGAYRPRRPGEVPRPAFDSRVLGLLTSPESLGRIISETLNYQFGFEITRSWFYQLLSKAVTPLVIFAILVLVLFSSVVIVEPYEQAVITTNGRITRIADPGLCFKMPWPIGGVEHYPVGRTSVFSVGSAEAEHRHEGHEEHEVAILWTESHTMGKEEYLVTAPTTRSQAQEEESDRESGGGAPGVSLLAGEVIVQYRIRRDEGLKQYVTAAAKPEDAISAIADRRVAQYYLSRDVDELLTRGRFEAGDKLRSQIQADVDEMQVGLEVLFVCLSNVHPPMDGDVAASFQQQIEAELEQQTAIEMAKAQAIHHLASAAGSSQYGHQIDEAILELEQLKQERGGLADDKGALQAKDQQIRAKKVEIDRMLTTAGGAAAKKIYDARAYRWQRGISERAKADRFTAELAAYNQAPRYYLAKRRLDAIAAGLANSRKIIIGAGVKAPIIELDMKETRSALSDIVGGGE